MASWVFNFWSAVLAVFISAMGFSLADVIVDGIAAERSRTQKEAGKLQSVCRAAIMIGALLVAYLSGILVEAIGARNVFWITGILPLFTSILAIIIKETTADVKIISIKETWFSLKNAMTPALLWAVLFMFIWRATPSSGGALSYFMIDEIKFSPEFFGRLSLISSAMGIAGVLIFRKFLLNIPLNKLFFWIIIASIVLSMPTIGLVYGWYEYIGVSPKLFAMADTFISAPLSEIAFIPLMVLTARLCPKGIEATMFAILASVMNIGLAISDLGGAALVSIFNVNQATETIAANYTHLDKVLWIAILSSLLPMPLLKKLPDIRAANEIIYEGTPSLEAAIKSSVEPEKKEIV